KFKASGRWTLTKLLLSVRGSASSDSRDLSVELHTFSLIQHIPKQAIKVAESGLKPSKIPEIKEMGYDAVLVGTSLLKAPQGIQKMLAEFEDAIAEANRNPMRSGLP